MRLIQRIKEFLKRSDREWIDLDEGYETDYDYAPAVVSRYRGPLLPNDDYVEVFEQIEKHGIASLLPKPGKK